MKWKLWISVLSEVEVSPYWAKSKYLLVPFLLLLIFLHLQNAKYNFMKNDKDNVQLSEVEDHDGILTIRGGGSKRDWNGIHYKQGMSAKNVGTTKLSANIATTTANG